MDSVEPEDVADGIEKLAKAFVAFKISMAAFKVGGAIAQSLTFLLENLTALKAIGTIAIVITVAKIGFDIGKEIGKALDPEDTEWYDDFTWFGEDGFFEYLSRDWETTLDGVGDFLTSGGLLGTLFPDADISSGLMSVLFPDGIIGTAENGFETIASWVSDFYEDIKEKFNEFADLFTKENIEELLSGFKDGIKKAFTGAANAGIGIFNKLIEAIETLVNDQLEGIRQLAKLANYLPDVKIDVDAISVSIPRIPTIPVTGYAMGGFPESYSLFMAGEHGTAEILGTVGGKTAVAGGEEITGIRDAIYSASQQELQMMMEQNQLLRGILEKEFGITEKEIGKAARNYARSEYRRTGKHVYEN